MTSAEPIDPPRRARVSLGAIVLGVAVLALVLRLAFVGTLLHQNASRSYDWRDDDASQYLDLARNVVELGHFANDGPGVRPKGTTYFSLLRPPAYPLLCAAFERANDRPGILWTQAILGAALPAIVAWLAGTMLRSRAAAAATGVVSAISPLGIGLTGLVLADLSFAVVFAAGFALLWQATRGPRAAWWYAAGATFGLACMVKPIGLYWTLATPPVAWLLARAVERRVRWPHLAGGLAIGVAMMLGWAARNYALARVFTVSTVDAQNLRYYLAPAVEEWIRSDGDPTRKKTRALRSAAMSRDIDDVGRITPREMYLRQWRESLAVLRPNPGATIAVMYEHIEGHFRSGFSHFDAELPDGGVLRRALYVIENARRNDATDDAVVALLIVAIALPPLVPRRRRDVTWRARYFATLALAATFAYLVVFTGTTTSTGARIVYPAQFAELILLAAGATSIARDGRAIVRAIREPRDDSSTSASSVRQEWSEREGAHFVRG